MECFHIEERGCFATPALRRENLMKGDVILIYPRTDSFHEPLPVFEFPKAKRPTIMGPALLPQVQDVERAGKC